jgi:hypothetical protein
MSESRPPTDPAPSTRPTWIVVGVLLAAGTVVPLLVGIYDTEAPTLGGFPFFYWFQFLLIPIVSALTFIAFRLSESATARDRAARRAPGRAGGAE